MPLPGSEGLATKFFSTEICSSEFRAAQTQMKATRACGTAFVIALLGCSSSPPRYPPAPIAVRSVRLQRGTIGIYETLNGQVNPYLQATISTQQSGTIISAPYNEGDRVRKGTQLARIDDSTLRAQLLSQQGVNTQSAAHLSQSQIQLPITGQQYASALTQAEQSLRQARQQQVTDRAAVSNTKLTYQANHQLLALGYVPQTAYEQARANYIAAVQTLAADTSKVNQAIAGVNQARRNLLNVPLQQQVIAENRGLVEQSKGDVQLLRTEIAQTRLLAPFDGVVTQRLLDPGAYAGPNQPIYQLSQIDPVYIDFNVRDIDLAYVRSGKLVSFTTSAQPHHRYTGRVATINVIPTNVTLLYRARIVEPNPDNSLRGGMLVSVLITKQLRRNILIAPRSAITQTTNGAELYALQPTKPPSLGTIAVRIPIRLGIQTSDRIEIEPNPHLQNGTPIVSGIPETLHNGAHVRAGGDTAVPEADFGKRAIIVK